MQCHFAKRIVIELDDVPFLSSFLIGQLMLLKKRVAKDDGLLRLCGLNDAGRASLRIARLSDLLEDFDNREAAVMGYRPAQPR